MRTRSLLLLLPLLSFAACAGSEPAPEAGAGDVPYLSDIPMLGSFFMEDAMDTPTMVDIPNYTILSQQVAGGGFITAEQVATLPGKGYTTVINLQYERESGVAAEIAAAEAAGLQYVSVPVGGGNFTLEHAKQVSDAIAQAPGHVLLHCRSGGRVSAVWALTRALDEGLTPEEAAVVAAEEGCRPIPESMVERVRTELREAR
ncbi:MAG: beta-lactamase hydrolase domain-containing protein [Planctomycetota bacterium]